ncbi:MAG: methyltransferase domain-containing protein [Deltaproteobacteria bacterium]|nr:methyltransferase domain-containing protein [Deltaproteobacteria bacterium]
MEMNPSELHTNKRHHNWLIYRNYDRFLKKSGNHCKGILYDLGCGESPYKDFFLQHANQYIGVDWSSSIHNTKADINADLNKRLPISSEVADTVVSFSVLEHLCEPQQMINEAFRILKREGWIILHVPWQWWIHEAPHDYFRYTPYGLKYIFEKAGFVDVRVEPVCGFFSMMILKLNYFSLRLVRGLFLLRGAVKVMLIPLWYIGQYIAPWLDRLDRNWLLEAAGYNVTARKP